MQPKTCRMFPFPFPRSSSLLHAQLAGAAANEAIGLDAPPVTIPLATTASLLYAVRHPLMHFATAATESLLSMDMVKTVLSHSSIQVRTSQDIKRGVSVCVLNGSFYVYAVLLCCTAL